MRAAHRETARLLKIELPNCDPGCGSALRRCQCLKSAARPEHVSVREPCTARNRNAFAGDGNAAMPFERLFLSSVRRNPLAEGLPCAVLHIGPVRGGQTAAVGGSRCCEYLKSPGKHWFSGDFFYEMEKQTSWDILLRRFRVRFAGDPFARIHPLEHDAGGGLVPAAAV